MFARRLAIGVRSSWLASATRWRCASTERSSASSVALKLRASRASSSSPATSSRCDRSGLPVIASVRRVKRAIGASAVRATHAPSTAAERDAGRRRRRAGRAAAGRSAWSTSRQRPRDLHGAASPRPTVSTRRCTPSTVDVVKTRPLPARARSRGRARRPGSAAGLAGVAAATVAVRRDDLHVARGAAERGWRRRARRRSPKSPPPPGAAGRAAGAGPGGVDDRVRAVAQRARRSARAARRARSRTAPTRERDQRRRPRRRCPATAGDAGAQAHGSRST